MEQIVFLLIVATVAALRWTMNYAERKRNEDAARRTKEMPRPNAPVVRAPRETDEERTRRFMEALGVPTANLPPSETPRRRFEPRNPVPQTRKIQPIDPFPIPRRTTVAPTPTPPVIMAAPPVVVSPPQTVTTARPAVQPQTVPQFEVAEVNWASEQPINPVSTSAGPTLVRQKVVDVDQSQNWVTRLASSDGAREAIVLREIFGPPRSLQPFDLTAIEF